MHLINNRALRNAGTFCASFCVNLNSFDEISNSREQVKYVEVKPLKANVKKHFSKKSNSMKTKIMIFMMIIFMLT